jgi:hypothetical protein
VRVARVASVDAQEIYPPSITDVVELTDGAATVEDVERMEGQLARTLAWDLTPCSVATWLAALGHAVGQIADAVDVLGPGGAPARVALGGGLVVVVDAPAAAALATQWHELRLTAPLDALAEARAALAGAPVPAADVATAALAAAERAPHAAADAARAVLDGSGGGVRASVGAARAPTCPRRLPAAALQRAWAAADALAVHVDTLAFEPGPVAAALLRLALGPDVAPVVDQLIAAVVLDVEAEGERSRVAATVGVETVAETVAATAAVGVAATSATSDESASRLSAAGHVWPARAGAGSAPVSAVAWHAPALLVADGTSVPSTPASLFPTVDGDALLSGCPRDDATASLTASVFTARSSSAALTIGSQSGDATRDSEAALSVFSADSRPASAAATAAASSQQDAMVHSPLAALGLGWTEDVGGAGTAVASPRRPKRLRAEAAADGDGNDDDDSSRGGSGSEGGGGVATDLAVPAPRRGSCSLMQLRPRPRLATSARPGEPRWAEAWRQYRGAEAWVQRVAASGLLPAYVQHRLLAARVEVLRFTAASELHQLQPHNRHVLPAVQALLVHPERAAWREAEFPRDHCRARPTDRAASGASLREAACVPPLPPADALPVLPDGLTLSQLRLCRLLRA